MSKRIAQVDPSRQDLSISKQCELLGIPRASFYYDPAPESECNLQLMRLIDEQYMSKPFYGSRSMTAHFRNQGLDVNRKRITRLMRQMGIEAIYPKPKREAWKRQYGKFPYLLKGMDISPQNLAWGTDITYIPVSGGYLYLVAVMDLYSRYILSWELSNSLESDFCVRAMESALKFGVPKIANSDQGVQYTSRGYIELLQSAGIQISMSGKGRCWDNIFVERFWRSLKYEEVYINQYSDANDALEGIGSYISIYNTERVHASLSYRTPKDVYLVA